MIDDDEYRLDKTELKGDTLRCWISLKKPASETSDNKYLCLCMSLAKPGKFDQLLTPKATIKAVNKKERSMRIRTDNLVKITHYDKFLWVKEHTDTLPMSLHLEFSQDAKADPSCHADLQFLTQENSDGQIARAIILTQGDPLNGNTLRVNPRQSEVTFDFTVENGSPYGEFPAFIRLTGNTLDRVGDSMVQHGQNLNIANFTLVYEKVWNPLATVLFWIGIAILLAILLWFLCLRRIVFPKFKVSKIIIEGPGNYFISKKLKTSRKVILTSRKRSQNIISEIFTGKVIFICADHWQPEIIFEPGRRKSINAKIGSQWTITPSNLLTQDMKYKLTNISTKAQSSIEVE